MSLSPKRILVAPLNWGLGHATRCIPIIKALQAEGFEPIIASDGAALALLQQEFPELLSLTLPSYQIEYPKKGIFFKWKMVKNSPKMMEAMLSERKTVKQWVKFYNLQGIISDNRLGVYSKKVPSVFITHQLNVLSGYTSWISSKLHQFIIKKYTECWVPDHGSLHNLSGKLGHLSNPHFKITYIGPLSRFTKKELPITQELLVVLSGPEPQRTLLEEQLIASLPEYSEKTIFVKGVVAPEQTVTTKNNVTYYNYMTTEQLETALNTSAIVLCRSGYTSVMDLAHLEKKAFFIPTPGQYEQEYLAKKYKKELIVPYCSQHRFQWKKLQEVPKYKGLRMPTETANWKKLFLLFERE
jgi:UDP:flavonoid glycosyltransferase YjiC (YdhE family)